MLSLCQYRTKSRSSFTIKYVELLMINQKFLFKLNSSLHKSWHVVISLRNEKQPKLDVEVDLRVLLSIKTHLPNDFR